MKDNVHNFRRVKWGDPKQKLPVLVEDLPETKRERRSARLFVVAVVAVAISGFGVGFMI